MAKVFILVMLSTLIVLTGCNSSSKSSEPAPPQFVFQQSATPLEITVPPSVMAGQSANITIHTSPGAFVSVGIIYPNQPPAKGYDWYVERVADDKGIFTSTFNTRYGESRVSAPGYYRLIANAEAVLVDEARYERYLILGLSKEDMVMRGAISHSGNITIVITSFLVR
ncbi:MAG: hypothetical protein Q8O55_04320 [Dehalococcoidales bacterium]|nr:hypothetical protein [Dehalococcoidales bacterium]